MAATDSFFPSPTVSAFHLGPLTIHFYALCILAGIAIAIWPLTLVECVKYFWPTS